MLWVIVAATRVMIRPLAADQGAEPCYVASYMTASRIATLTRQMRRS